jgi:ribonuclease BN (tRNA processing enzyme)
MAKIRFIGVGSAFAGRILGQSNMIVESDTGKKLAIDCGARWRDMMEDNYGIHPGRFGEVDAVYISHAHADHIGGLEELALCTLFNPQIGTKPKLFCIDDLMEELWDNSLQGGLSTLQVGKANLETFFECRPIKINDSFEWEGITFTPVQTVHVVSGFAIQHCYGLMIQNGDTDDKDQIFITGDTQFAPEQLVDFYKVAKVVFHDCEVTPFRSRVHAHFDDLAGLPGETRSKMWLYHHNSEQDQEKATAAGFLGFVEVGQEFEF